MSVGTLIRAARVRAGISGLILSARLGIDDSVLRKIELGQVSITADRILLIARILGIPVQRLFPPRKKRARNQSRRA